jgi:hypothetical protein
MTERKIYPEFWFEDIVQLKLRPDVKGMVVGIFISPSNVYLYSVSWEDGTDSESYDIELEYDNLRQ